MKLAEVQLPQNQLSADQNALRGNVSETVSMLQNQHEHQRVMLNQHQYYHESIAHRLSNLETSHFEDWKPQINPVVHESVPSNVPRSDHIYSMAVQSPSTAPPNPNVMFAQNVPDVHPQRNNFDHIPIPDPFSVLSQRELRFHKLNPSPWFESRQLNDWVRNLRYWRDLYSAADEQQILSPIGLSATDELRGILMGFPEETKVRLIHDPWAIFWIWSRPNLVRFKRSKEWAVWPKFYLSVEKMI